jgi:(E)-4-hydroxy-3-methylbut-2-enyl-diphosphate synthase
VAYEILKALELRHRGINVIACPTCGRVEFDVIKVANELEQKLAHVREPITISVLGCVVNGIGEGKEADIGIAGGGKGVGLLFRHGEVVRKIPMETLTQTLMEEVALILKERAAQRTDVPAPAGQS